MISKSFSKVKDTYLLWLLMICLITPLMYACGGNGGGDITEVVPTYGTISGKASKGPIYPGKVTAYKVVGGQKDGVLGTAQTDSNGNYTISFTGYSGAVILEVSGTYRDEATGDPNQQIDPNNPFHAMLSSTTGVIKTAITPLTEIAYQRATEIGKNSADPNIVFDSITIEQANTELSNSFGLDIIRTLPVNVLDPNALGANTNDAQIKYGLYLAALSKMAADSNSIDGPIDMVRILADQIKDGKIGESGEITLNDIGDALVEVIDPNNDIIDPNIVNLDAVQVIAEDQSKIFDNISNPNDPNGVDMSGSPTSGESPLEQAKAMIEELRTMVLNAKDPIDQEGTRLVSEIESLVIPELEEIGQMADILGQGIQTILDDPNVDYPDLDALIQDPQNNMPIEVTTDFAEDYEVTLGADFATGVMLSSLLDPNFHADLQDPNCWYTLVDPNFFDKLVDPNIQAELQDPNLLVQFAQFDPNMLSELANILSKLEDPNIDLFFVEATYALKKNESNKGAGALQFALDRNNKKISLLTFTGYLELASGTASLTDCGIHFWEDPLDPNKSGMTLQFGTLETPHLMADANFVVNVQCLNNIIREGDLLALNLLSLKGSFEVLNSTQWDGEISLSEPVIVAPNFSYQTLVLPSKIELKGSYTIPDSISFDGTITAEFHNVRELYTSYELGESQVDPNVTIKSIGTLAIAGSEDIRLEMTVVTAQTNIYTISPLTFTHGGISITGNITVTDNLAALNLQNQDGIEILLNMDGIFTGEIRKDGIKLGIFEEVSGIPRVKYYDGYFESLF